MVAVREGQSSDAMALAYVLASSLRVAYADRDATGTLAGLTPDALVDGARWRLRTLPAGARLLVAEHHGAVVGFAQIDSRSPWARGEHADLPADRGELASLYVSPRSWGRGMGRALLAGALTSLQDAGCGSVELWVAADNPRAVRLYERAGFVHEGRARRHPMEVWGIDLGFALDVVAYSRALAPSASLVAEADAGDPNAGDPNAGDPDAGRRRAPHSTPAEPSVRRP